MLRNPETTLEWRSNQDGDLVAFENSKALSDFESPRGEAQVWLKQQIQPASEPQKIVIVGVGSGYHIEAAAKAYPYSEIIAIDCRTPLSSFYSRKLRNVQFINVESLQELMISPYLNEFMKGASLKLAFRSSFGEQKQILEEVFYFLNIRTYEALSTYLKKNVNGPSNILINIRHLFENALPQELPYKMSEVLTLQEIAK